MMAPVQYAIEQHGFHPHLVARPQFRGLPPRVRRGGTGDATSLSTMGTSQLASYATATAGGITAAILPLVGLGPIGGIVAAGTALISQIISMFHGCGQSCTLTSQAADQIESGIKQIIAAYQASGHTASEQAAALQQFDAVWAKLVEYCGQPSFGQAGQNCTADRQAGACKWKSSPFGWTQVDGSWQWVESGPNGSGSSCWNWFNGYRDQIAKDPNVRPDTPAVTAAAQALGISGSSASSLIPVALMAGLLIVLMMAL